MRILSIKKEENVNICSQKNSRNKKKKEGEIFKEKALNLVRILVKSK